LLLYSIYLNDPTSHVYAKMALNLIEKVAVPASKSDSRKRKRSEESGSGPAPAAALRFNPLGTVAMTIFSGIFQEIAPARLATTLTNPVAVTDPAMAIIV
jgi:hypothetical protein